MIQFLLSLLFAWTEPVTGPILDRLIHKLEFPEGGLFHRITIDHPIRPLHELNGIAWALATCAVCYVLGQIAGPFAKWLFKTS